MRFIPFIAFAALGVMTASAAKASPIAVTSVSASGAYNNSLSLLTDGIVPPEFTIWNSAPDVWWNGTATIVTFNLGGDALITSALASVDNNDTYEISTSLDGTTFNPLFTILPTDGDVPPAPGGTKIVSTAPSLTNYHSDLAFAPVTAEFLRLQALGGDDEYAVGELDLFGTPPAPPAPVIVPEPMSLMLLGTGLMLLGMIRSRTR